MSKNIIKKTYDVILPLGCNCTPALELEKQAKRVTSYPYDWLLNTTNSPTILLESILHGIHPLENREQRTENREQRTENLVFTEYNGLQQRDCYLDTRTGIEYKHDFIPNIPLEEMLPLCIEKYQRRMERLIQHLHNAKTVCFVLHNYTNMEGVEPLVETIRNTYAIHIDILCTSDETLQEQLHSIHLTGMRDTKIHAIRFLRRLLSYCIPHKGLRRKMRYRGSSVYFE